MLENVRSCNGRFVSARNRDRHLKQGGSHGSRDSDIWSGTWSNGSQMSESNH
jgi:hypothetical protein